jgi:hypothetical protein
MAASADKRGSDRVLFTRGIETYLMAIDGTWRRACTMHDVSATGARLHIADSMAGLNLKEFFLVLSASGMAFRRCEIAWVDGEHVGARFLEKSKVKKKADPRT